MNRFIFTLLLLSTLIFLSIAVCAAETQEESYWATAISASPAAASIRWLQEDKGKFLGLYEKNLNGARRGGAIILHDAGGHPDWPSLIRPLRTRLPHHGWSTLAIQLPAMMQPIPKTSDARLLDESTKRVSAAVTFLKAQGISRIILIGYGTGATLAAAILASKSAIQTRTLIAISPASMNDKDQHLNIAENIGRLSLPILDIFASGDLSSVTRSAAQRRVAGAQRLLAASQPIQPPRLSGAPDASRPIKQPASGSRLYRQLVIDGADHSYSGYEDMIVKRITSWLKRLVVQTAIARN